LQVASCQLQVADVAAAAVGVAAVAVAVALSFVACSRLDARSQLARGKKKVGRKKRTGLQIELQLNRPSQRSFFFPQLAPLPQTFPDRSFVASSKAAFVAAFESQIVNLINACRNIAELKGKSVENAPFLRRSA